MSTTGSSPTSSAEGWPCSTATTTAGPTSTWREGSTRRRSTATRAWSARSHSPGSTAPPRRLTDVTGAYPIDIDSDGITDLAVLRFGENIVLRGLGDCNFERANERWSIDGGNEWTVAFSATWEGDAAFPTMAFGNYVELGPSGEQTGRCSDHMLLRPSGMLVRDPTSPLAWVVHALDPLQRLGSIRSTRPADDQRPPLLPRR